MLVQVSRASSKPFAPWSSPKNPCKRRLPARPTWSSSAPGSSASRPRASFRSATTASASPSSSASRRSARTRPGAPPGSSTRASTTRPGSLKARLCVEGARELYDFCDERGIPTERGGKLIVATRPEELPRLDELERRGVANEVPGLARVGQDEIADIEPHARGIEALHSPATGTVDFRVVAARVRGRRGGGRRHRHHGLRGARHPRARRRRRGRTRAGARRGRGRS